MQRAHIEQVQQQMSERRRAQAAKSHSKRNKPVSAQLPKVIMMKLCIFMTLELMKCLNSVPNEHQYSPYILFCDK